MHIPLSNNHSANVSVSSHGFFAAITSFSVIEVAFFLTFFNLFSKSSKASSSTASFFSSASSCAFLCSARCLSTFRSLNVKCLGILNRLCNKPNFLVDRNESSMDIPACESVFIGGEATLGVTTALPPLSIVWLNTTKYRPHQSALGSQVLTNGQSQAGLGLY